MLTTKELADQAMDIARKTIEGDQNEPIPCFFGVDENGESLVVMAPFEGNNLDEVEECKNRIVTMIKMLFFWKRVVGYSFTSTAWTIKEYGKYEDRLDTRPPSERPDREEIVLVYAETKDGNLFETSTINRSDENKMYLNEEIEILGVDEAPTNRFGGLLAPKNLLEAPIPEEMYSYMEKQFGPREDITVH